MLTSSPLTTILPVIDMKRACDFYENKLGLKSLGLQKDGKFLFRCGETTLALIPKPGGTKADHTAISFEVKNILEEIRALKKLGVEFSDYDLPGLKTVEHVCVLGAEKAAWFNDPEGNILCLHENI